MKQLLIAVLCLATLNAMSQGSGTRELNIYGSNSRLVIGHVSVNQALQTKLFLIKSTQKKDSLNNYVTTFYLGNKDTSTLASIKILLRFSKPVIDVAPSFTTAFNNVKGLSDDHLIYLFKAAPLKRDPGSAVVISFVVKSKEKIITDISGLDGIK